MLNSVSILPSGAGVVFTQAMNLFREDRDFSTISVQKQGFRKPIEYIPWGSDNQMPYTILDKVESDETLSACLRFQAECYYGNGLEYRHNNEESGIRNEDVKRFITHNDLQSLFFGTAQDFNTYGFSIIVLVLDKEVKHIIRIERKEAAFCRFEKSDTNGRIPGVLYGDFRYQNQPEALQYFPLLDQKDPLADLYSRTQKNKSQRVYAVLSRIPTVNATYYPIPLYASIFKSRWFDTKQLIAQVKYAKLKNTTSFKYQIEINDRYWQKLFQAEGIVNRTEQAERVRKEKQQMVDFLTGAENAGKVLFSAFYISPDGQEQRDVKITRIDTQKEGGDYETDLQEVINIICFALGVHSNLIGTLPSGKQMNNSGSDKRELYTIAQAKNKVYRDILLQPHRLVCAFNGWQDVTPVVDFLQLTTLDEHRDIAQASS